MTSPSPAGAIGFESVAPNLYLSSADDAVTVPPGYTARVLVAWGDSLSKAPNWDPASAMDEETQLHCYGSHTDGMHYFPFPQAKSQQANSRGLLVTNSEYCDPPLVNNVKPAANYATVTMTLDMVRAQQAAHGVNVVEVEEKNGTWSVRRGSAFNRRITGNTPCRISGPAAGHELMKTAADPGGKRVLGTLNNCAHGYTPWGTYLTCEENWNGYFSNETGDVEGELDLDRKFNIIKGQTRYGVIKGGFGYRWHEVDERFRADLHPNEPNRFGWVVEIDPQNPQSTPIKRTAMGRFKHESAQLVVDRRQPCRVLHGRRRAQRVRLQVRLRQAAQSGRQEHRPRHARQGHALRRQVQRRRQRQMAAAGVGPERPDPGERLRRPGRGAGQDPPGRRPPGRHHDGPSGVDRSPSQHRRGLPDPHQQQPPRQHACLQQQR
jgi:uncharacterized protein